MTSKKKVDMKLCPYRFKNFAKESLCILDPDHFAMEDNELTELVRGSILNYSEDERDGKSLYWKKYAKAIKIVKNKCAHLDKDGINDTSKRVIYIPDLDVVDRIKRLIPDDSFGTKCRCLYPNKYQK